MDNFTLNISFWFYLIALPWLGLFGAKVLPFSKQRIIYYLAIISLFVITSLFRICFSNQILQVIALVFTLYILSEIIWHSKKLNNKFLRISVPTLWVLFIYFYTIIVFFAAIAGGRIFPPYRKVSSFYNNLVRYEIIEKQYADCGTSVKNYILYKGLRFLPFHKKTDFYYQPKSTLIEVDSVYWNIENNRVDVTLFSIGEPLGHLIKRKDMK